MSEGPGSAGTGKKQNWGWSRYMYICFRVILFGLGWGSLWVTYVSHIYLCLWFRFMVPESFYLCSLSRSVPLRFYVNFSYQQFSLWGLAVLCEWLDGHSSLFLFLARTDTLSLTLSLDHIHSEQWLMFGWSVWGARAAEAGWCWQYVKWRGSPGQPSSALFYVSNILEPTIHCFDDFSLFAYCSSERKKKKSLHLIYLDKDLNKNTIK